MDKLDRYDLNILAELQRNAALSNQELAERIASGDLSRDVAAMNQDEVGQLVGAMGRMQDSLRGLVRQVQDAAGNISTASSEIASGNHDLSHRTEQTAHSLKSDALRGANML
mgnify:CR=1 FL=1